MIGALLLSFIMSGIQSPMLNDIKQKLSLVGRNVDWCL